MTHKTISITNYIPTTISQEAQDFIRDQSLIEDHGVSLDNIDAIREATLVDNTPGVEMVCRETGVSYEDIEIAGVKVMVVTPKGYNSDNDDRGVLYFFGGGFIDGSPYRDLSITARLAAATGLKFYAPWYSLAPEQPYPAAFDDCFAVYKALVSTMRAGGLSIAGESAGGNLALSIALKADQSSLPAPASLALLSPWSDLSNASESVWNHAGIDPTFTTSIDDGTISRAYAGDMDLQDPRVSPLFEPYTNSFPSTLITSGTRDMFLSHCARLSTKLRQAGVDVQLNLWEGMWHVFEFYPTIPEAKQSLNEIAQFLTEHTR